jgi:glyoxylase-like metal-dependent hydrolase (beta-lactamase superfamily II)
MSVKISSVEGNRQFLDGGAMFGNAPRPVWEKWIAPDAKGRIPLACRSMLVELNGKKILCETGIGAFFEPKLADRFGVENPSRHLLLENLAQLGVKPEDIDEVILSHLHFDHAGGLLPTYDEQQNGNASLVFPKARFWVGLDAWERAEHPHFRDKASFIPGLNEKLKNSGRLLIIRSGKDIPAEYQNAIEFVFTEGHTPGQMHTLIKGGAQPAFFCGDLIPGMAWVHLPITMGYDRFPEKLIDEKSKLYGRIEKENWLLFFTHDPSWSAASLHRTPEGKYEPKAAKKDLIHATI